MEKVRGPHANYKVDADVYDRLELKDEFIS